MNEFTEMENPENGASLEVEVELEVSKGHPQEEDGRVSTDMSKSGARQRTEQREVSVCLKLSCAPPSSSCPLPHAPHLPSQGTESGA